MFVRPMIRKDMQPRDRTLVGKEVYKDLRKQISYDTKKLYIKLAYSCPIERSEKGL